MNARRWFLLTPMVGLALAASPAQALIAFGPPAPLNSTAASDSDDQTDDDGDREVAIATDGAGAWVAAWVSDNPNVGGAIGSDFDILAATSSDGGESWSAAFPAMPDAATDGGAPDNSPALAGSGGTFVLAFSSGNSLGGTVGGDSDILFTRSTNSGATWSAAALLNSGGASDGTFDLDVRPSIATNGSGDWLVVWQRQTIGGMGPTGYQALYSYSTDDGATWSAQQSLGGLQSLSVGNGQGTAVAWNGTSFVVAWGSSENLGSNGTDGDILYSVISVPGFAASAAALLNDTGTTDTATESDQFPSLSADGSTVVAVWESNANVGGAGSDDDVFFARSTDGGATWSTTGVLNANATSDTGEDNATSVANDGTTFLVAWDSTDPLGKLVKDDRDILVSRSDDGGATWSDPAPLATNAFKDKGADEDVSLAADPASGTWNAAWTSSDTLGKVIGGDDDVLFSHASEDCPAAPVLASTCFQSTVSGASALTIKEGGDKDSLLWKFLKGEAVDYALDLGEPDVGDDYVMCVYDGSTLILELDIEAGGTCAGKPCWADTGLGYTYKHKQGLVSGASLVSGAAGLSKASVKAKGAFRAPTLPLAGPTVAVRLHGLDTSRCFANDFSSPATNDSTFYKAKAD